MDLSHEFRRLFPSLCFGLGFGLVVFAAARACPAQSREFDIARRQVVELRDQAELHRRAGRHDQAEAALKRAQDLADKIERASARLPPEKAPDARRAEILNGLEAGIRALRALGRQEDATHLLEILREYSGHKKDVAGGATQDRREDRPATDRRPRQADGAVEGREDRDVPAESSQQAKELQKRVQRLKEQIAKVRAEIARARRRK